MKKIIFISMLALSIILLSFPAISFADGVTTVSTFADLQSALQQPATGSETVDNPTVIMVSADITATAVISVQGFKTLVSDLNNHTITRGQTTAHMFNLKGASASAPCVLNIGIPNNSTYGLLTFDGTSASAISLSTLYVDAYATLNFNNGTVTKANASGNYGAVKSTSSGIVHIGNVTFTSNSSGTGACIYSAGAELTVNGATFTGNTSTGITAGQGAGAIYSGSAVTTISNSNFTNNISGTSSTGSVMLFIGTSTVPVTLNLTNCTIDNGNVATGSSALIDMRDYVTATFSGNTIQNSGERAVSVSKATSTLTVNSGTISNCKFTSTAATTGGGAIYSVGTVYINGGTISDCVSTSTTVASTGGGAIYNNAGKLYITNGTITRCSAVTSGSTTPAAGAIYSVGSAAVISITGGTITNCTTTGNGGAIFTAGASSFIFSASASISGCTASVGGGIYVSSGTVNLNGGSISGCIANSATTDTGGGAVYNNGTLNIDGVSISNCTATTAGGGVITGSGTPITNLKSGTIDGCSSPKGGGIYNFKGTLTVSGGTIQNCTTSGSGGGISNAATLITNGGLITGCASNTTTTTASSGGGGIYNKSTMTINDITIQNCTSAFGGGGILHDVNSATSAMHGGIIDNCTAKNGGGITSTMNTFTVDGGTIKNCTSANGGGIKIVAGTLVLNGGLITDCEATADTGTTLNGGGVSSSGIVNITNGTIQNCSAKTSGGGIYFSKSDGALTITGGTIQNCSTLGSGGAILHAAGTTNLNGGLITGCTAPAGAALTEGNGIVNLNGGSITNCLGKTIQVSAGAINYGAGYILHSSISEPQRIYLSAGYFININSDITTPGRVAVIEHWNSKGTNTVSFKGTNFATNLDHFAGYVAADDKYYGFNTLGYIDDAVTAPKEAGEVEPSITDITGITGNATDGYTVDFTLAADIDPMACIIIALYDASGNLVGVNSTLTTTDTTTDITVTRTAVLAKLMVWDNLSDIKPLIDVVPHDI